MIARRRLLRRTWYALEAGVAYAFYGLALAFPLDAGSAVGGWVGRTVGPRLPVSNLGRRNLKLAFPDMSREEIEATLRAMWDNFGRMGAEYPHIREFWDESVRADYFRVGEAELRRRAEAGEEIVLRGRRVEAHGFQHIIELMLNPRGAIFFSAHMGNFEIMPLWSAQIGLPTHSVYRVPNNPHMARLIARIRRGLGKLLPKGVQAAVLCGRVLESGGQLGLMVDQKHSRGIPVPFFGRDAMTAPMIARLALKYRCPVYGAYAERTGGAHFRIHVTPPIPVVDTGDPKRDEMEVMRRINQEVESWIRRRPDQWMWVHRRWGG